jgi:hypothetical protein
MEITHAVAMQALWFVIVLLVFATVRELWFQLAPRKTKVRFSLRTLLIVMTLVAITLGIITWAIR